MVVQNSEMINLKLIMMNNKQEIQFKKNLASYLSELKRFTGIEVTPESLSSVEEVKKIREQSLYLKDTEKIKLVMNFEKKNSERFKHFITNLNTVNNNAVYIWTDSTNVCGLYQVASIKAINFSFSFDVISSGIVAFVTKDLNDKMLLDFYRDSKDEEILEVELQ
jgi:hypothetical protein